MIISLTQSEAKDIHGYLFKVILNNLMHSPIGLVKYGIVKQKGTCRGFVSVDDWVPVLRARWILGDISRWRTVE